MYKNFKFKYFLVFPTYTRKPSSVLQWTYGFFFKFSLVQRPSDLQWYVFILSSFSLHILLFSSSSSSSYSSSSSPPQLTLLPLLLLHMFLFSVCSFSVQEFLLLSLHFFFIFSVFSVHLSLHFFKFSVFSVLLRPIGISSSQLTQNALLLIGVELV